VWPCCNLLLVGWCLEGEHGGVGNLPVESDGRPRGSFNRWNYNEVYRPATPSPDGVVTGSRETKESRETVRLPESDTHYHRWRQPQRLRSYTTSPPPTPGRRVELDAKSDVDWAYDSNSFYLRVSVKQLCWTYFTITFGIMVYKTNSSFRCHLKTHYFQSVYPAP